MIIDVHAHYTLSERRPEGADRFAFESPADPDSDLPAAFDTCLAPRVWQRPTWRGLRLALGLPPAGEQLDRLLEQRYAGHLLAPGPVERIVLLAFDAYHTTAGQMTPRPRRRRDLGTDIYSSNSLIRALCRRHPERFLFGASVHPYRADALAALDEVFAAGACLVKWMPLHQNIDPADPRTVAFFERCAEYGLPLLLHVGPEFALRTQHPAYGELTAFLIAFDHLRQRGAMPPAIIAHVATPVTPLGPWRHFRHLIRAFEHEFRDAPLYADISALTAVGKLPALSWLRQRPHLHRKLLFGSDFPVPPARPWLAWRYGPAPFSAPLSNAWPQFDAQVTSNAGFLDGVFTRAAELLPNVDVFAAAADTSGLTPPAKAARVPG